jgi:hypothetical protein
MNYMRGLLALFLVISGLGGCVQDSKKTHHTQRTFNHVYRDTKTHHVYVQDDGIWYLLMMNNQPYVSNAWNSSSPSLPTGSSWSRADITPNPDQIVEQPIEVETTGSEPPSTESLTPAEVESAEHSDTVDIDADQSSSDNTDSGSSDSGSSDPSGSSGGDSSGGDAGGGGGDAGGGGGDGGGGGGGE